MGFGNVHFQTELTGLSPGSKYFVKPIAITDQGIVYGDSITLNIKEEESLQPLDSIQMKIYPNPSNGDFTLKFQDNTYSSETAFIRISDLTGQIILNREISLTDAFISHEERFILSGYITNGFYSVILNIGSNSAASKLVIQK